jgi:hypothetical protein
MDSSISYYGPVKIQTAVEVLQRGFWLIFIVRRWWSFKSPHLIATTTGQVRLLDGDYGCNRLELLLLLLLLLFPQKSTHTLNERALAQLRDTETPAYREVGNKSVL